MMIQKHAPAAYSLNNFTVLLVDDYDFLRGLVVAMLKAFGVREVVVCSSAREAIEILIVNHTQSQHGSAKPIDFVLTDWMMPEGPGADLIQWMRNHKSDAIRFMPVIMLSTFASESAVMTARDFGANEILVKPVSAEKIASRILSIIDNPRPFIKAASFFGPDRRRRQRPWKSEERRMSDPGRVIAHSEKP